MRRRRHDLHDYCAGVCVVLIVAALWTASPGYAQDRCHVLCAPTLKIEPTLTFSNLFARPRVQELPDGEPERAARESAFEVILAVDIPTEMPRLGFTIEAIWTPLAETSSNPFTGATAGDLGVASLRDNPVELELETNFYLLTSRQTSGWLTSHVDLVDKFSPAERPSDRSTYTHKLNFELDTAVAIFNWLSDGRWLRRLEVEGSLDYVATGLPKRGNRTSAGELFLDDASPWSFSLVVVIPIAPVR